VKPEHVTEFCEEGFNLMSNDNSLCSNLGINTLGRYPAKTFLTSDQGYRGDNENQIRRRKSC
jgi:hypothetical protein